MDNKELYGLIKAGTCGGPAIIFSRYAEKGKTYTDSEKKNLVEKIIGLDCNSLYLWALSQSLPTGNYVVRRAEDNFQARHQLCRSVQSYIWMDWMAKKDGVVIEHKMNSGREHKIGPFYVDGFCAEKNTIYEYDGR